MSRKRGKFVRIKDPESHWHGQIGQVVERYPDRCVVWFEDVRMGDTFDPSDVEPASVVDRLGRVGEWDDS